MKKIFTIVLSCLLFQAAWAQTFTTVKGMVHSDKMREVTLFRTVDGALHEYAKTQVAVDGGYGFVFSPEEKGFYAVGTERMTYLFYAEGGETVNLDLYDKEAKLVGKNTKENMTLYQWEGFSWNLRLKGIYMELVRSTFRDFFPDLEKTLEQLPAFRKKLKSGNAEFDALLQRKIDYDMDYYSLMMLQTPRTEHPQASDYPEWYRHIVSKDKFCTDDVMAYPYGVRLIYCYSSFAFRQTGKEYSLDNQLAFLNNDRLKGELVLSSSRLKSYDQYLDMMNKYGKYFITSSQKKRAEAIGTVLYDTKAGGTAADFTYPDVNGKEVSLSDFKGKVVLVDVWATWCGPCRGEIPHLKKLEEEMYGTDVVFIGVSVDEAKDKQKWLDFVEKEELKGVQLLASGWSKITKDYKITGIPRFMVFDRKGNVVTVDAPRPSDPALKKMLEEELKK